MSQGSVGDFINTLPVLSQLKSLAQAVSGDTKGARLTQQSFLDRGILVSQVKSAVQAISGDTDGAKLTQEKFLASQVRILQGTGRLFTGYHLSNRLRHEAELARNPGWMAEVPDEVTLWGLTLPGTHHSTAYTFRNSGLNLPFYRTQKFSVYEQLLGGVRFIHTQLVHDTDGRELMCCTGQRDTKGKPHGRSLLTIPLATLLTATKSFLDCFNSEIVVLHVEPCLPQLPIGCRREPHTFWKDHISMFLGHHLYKGPLSSNTSLRDLRGKVVLVTHAYQIWSSLPHTRAAQPAKVIEQLRDLTKHENLFPRPPPRSLHPIPHTSSHAHAGKRNTNTNIINSPSTSESPPPPPAAGGSSLSEEFSFSALNPVLNSSMPSPPPFTTPSLVWTPDTAANTRQQQSQFLSASSGDFPVGSSGGAESTNAAKKEGGLMESGGVPWAVGASWGPREEAKAEEIAGISGESKQRLVIFHAHVSPSAYLHESVHQVLSVGGGLMSDAEVTNKLLLEHAVTDEKLMESCQALVMDFVHSDVVKGIVSFNLSSLHVSMPPSTHFPAARNGTIRYQRLPRWLSEKLRKSPMDDRDLSTMTTVQATCSRKVPINQGILREGTTVWVDRNYTFRHVPRELLGGTIIRWPHILPFNTRVTLTLSLRSVVYVIVERFHRNGGLPRSLLAKGWKQSNVEPSIPEHKYGRKPLTMLYKSFNPGIVALPALVEETCLSIVSVTQDGAPRSDPERQIEVLKTARTILETHRDSYHKIATLAARENDLLEALLRHCVIPSRSPDAKAARNGNTTTTNKSDTVTRNHNSSDDSSKPQSTRPRLRIRPSKGSDPELRKRLWRSVGDFHEERPGDLSVRAGETLRILDTESQDSGWVVVKRVRGGGQVAQGREGAAVDTRVTRARTRGCFPRCLLVPYSPALSPSHGGLRDTTTASSLNSSSIAHPKTHTRPHPTTSFLARVPANEPSRTDATRAEKEKVLGKGRGSRGASSVISIGRRKNAPSGGNGTPPAPKEAPPPPASPTMGDNSLMERAVSGLFLAASAGNRKKRKSSDDNNSALLPLVDSVSWDSDMAKGQALWEKLLALVPEEYKGRENEFQGIFNRWLVEILQDELFRVTSQLLTRQHPQFEKKREDGVSASERGAAAPVDMRDRPPRSPSTLPPNLHSTQPVGPRVVASPESKSGDGEIGETRETGHDQRAGRPRGRTAILPPHELLKLKAEIEIESRKGNNPGKIVELTKRLSVLSEALTERKFYDQSATAAAASSQHPSASVSSHKPTNSLNPNLSPNPDMKPGAGLRAKEVVAGEAHGSRMESEGLRSSEVSSDGLSEGRMSVPERPSTPSWETRGGVTPLGFAMACYRHRGPDEFPKVLNTGTLYAGGEDVIVIALGFGVAYVPRTKSQISASDVLSAASANLSANLSAKSVSPNKIRIAEIRLRNVTGILSHLEQTHLEYWFALEHLKTYYHRERMKNLDKQRRGTGERSLDDGLDHQLNTVRSFNENSVISGQAGTKNVGSSAANESRFFSFREKT